jgi:Galactose oxidase, central domain
MATLGNAVVLFGGANGSWLNDTWMFNGATWHQVNASNPPSPREAPSMATLDVSTIVLFGGKDSTGAFLNDTWTFDGSSWTQVGVIGLSPPGRYLAAMASLGVNSEQAVLFGGDDGTNAPFGDTWTFTAPEDWVQANVSITAPARSLGAMSGFQGTANDSVEVVLFGGDDINASLLGDTWTFGGLGNWEQQTASPGPPPRDGPSMAFVP